jgi:uncharacterized protein
MVFTGIAVLARPSDVPVGQTLVAALVFAGALATLAVGVGHTVSSVRTWWRRAIVIAVGAIALLYVVTPVAFGVFATNRARPALGVRTPADVGLRYDDVAIDTPAGRLAAWYVPSRNGAAVLALAGSGSTRDDLLDHASMLARHGFGVLLVDVPGHGGSGGEPMEFGWGGESYLRPALRALAERSDVTRPIGVFGLSMGGEQAITLAASDARVAAVVAEGASGRTWADAWNLPDALPARALSFPFHWLQTTSADLLADASPPIPLVDAVRAMSPRPLFLISGSSAIEQEANRTFADAAGSHATWWSIPDAPHIGGLRTHPAAYEERVIAFLEDALLEDTGSRG